MRIKHAEGIPEYNKEEGRKVEIILAVIQSGERTVTAERAKKILESVSILIDRISLPKLDENDEAWLNNQISDLLNHSQT